jgi:Zn-dependent alcohol dehydrogenase
VRAAVIRGPGQLAVEELDRPVPGPGEVLVRVAASGVCQSDLSVVEGRVPIPFPAVLGHEGSGVVEALGAGIADLEVGDHVVMSITPGCGLCFQCQNGSFGLCESVRSLDGTLTNGAVRLWKGGERINHYLFQSSFAEYVVITRWSAVKIRRDAPLDVAALLGCGVITGYGAVVRKARVGVGETVLVVGVGGVGLSVVMAAAVSGAATIICVDSKPAACELAMKMGGTHSVVVGSDTDLVGEVMRVTGRGVDYAFDAVGSSKTAGTAFGCLRAGGELVVIGLSGHEASCSVPLYSLIKERRVTGTTNGSIRPQVDIPAALDLFMDGKLPIGQLVQRRYRLEDIGAALSDLKTGVGRGVIVLNEQAV